MIVCLRVTRSENVLDASHLILKYCPCTTCVHNKDSIILTKVFSLMSTRCWRVKIVSIIFYVTLRHIKLRTCSKQTLLFNVYCGISQSTRTNKIHAKLQLYLDINLTSSKHQYICTFASESLLQRCCMSVSLPGSSHQLCWVNPSIKAQSSCYFIFTLFWLATLLQHL